jgi:phage tail protein X
MHIPKKFAQQAFAALCAAITSVNDVLAALLPIVTIGLVVFFPEIPSGR